MSDQNPSGLPALEGNLEDGDLLFVSRDGINILRSTWAILKAQILGLIAAAVAKESPASTVANASRNLAATDVNALVKVDSATPVVLTIMNDAMLQTTDDEVIATYQAGAGVVSFAAGAGVALRSPAGVTPSVQYASKAVQRVGANEWALLG